MFSLLQELLPTTDFSYDFGEMFHNQYQPLILQACVPSFVWVLMTVKENNSQISQQRPVNIQLSHGKLQTLRLQINTGIAIKIIVSTHHVYSFIFYRIIVFEISSFENVAKFLSIGRLYSVTLKAPGVERTQNYRLELELILDYFI